MSDWEPPSGAYKRPGPAEGGLTLPTNRRCTRASRLPRRVTSSSSSSSLPSFLFLALSLRLPCLPLVLLPGTSISFFPSSHGLRPETRKSSKGGRPVRWNHPLEDEERGEREREGGRQTAPTASLPVNEIKRRGRNLAEGCKYYKVTLRRMRELKGLLERE